MASEEGAEQIEVEVMDEVAAAGEEEGGNGMVMVIGGILCVVVVIILAVGGMAAAGVFSGGGQPCAATAGKCVDKDKKDAPWATGDKTTSADVTKQCTAAAADEGKCNDVKVGGEMCCTFTKADGAGDKPA